MYIKQIKSNELIVNIVKEILDNESFYNDCETNIKEIYADKQLTMEDIPSILKILVLVYNNYSSINVDNQDIKEVFTLLIIEIIKKINNTDESDEYYQQIITFILPQIDLLLISIESTGCWKKLLYCICCIKDNKATSRP